ncbi:MAG: hypothetical protein FJ387_15150, partial [Verrucomicrobia bacterium]|nr:hypothetical protein [Verrucomicrobiota bacterium]
AGSVTGSHRWRVLTNNRNEVFEGQNRGNNVGLSLAPLELELPVLDLTTPLAGELTGTGDLFWFKFTPGRNRDLQLLVDLQAAEGITALYLGRGYAPTPWQYDVAQQEGNAPDVSAFVSSLTDETWYGLVEARSLPGGAASIALSAVERAFVLTSVSPEFVGNHGQVTFVFKGAQLAEDMQYELVDALGNVQVAESVFFVNSSVAYPTFRLVNATLGRYTARVNAHGQIRQVERAVMVQQTRAANVQFEIAMPAAVRAGVWREAQIRFWNEGNVDAMAPLRAVVCEGGEVAIRDPFSRNVAWYTQQATEVIYIAARTRPARAVARHQTAEPTRNSMLMLFLAQDGPAGILRQGGWYIVPVSFRADSSKPQVRLGIGAPNETDEIDWAQDKNVMKPDYIDPEAWEAIFANFTQRVGRTFGEYNRALADVVSYASLFWRPNPQSQAGRLRAPIATPNETVGSGTAWNTLTADDYRPGRWLTHLLNLSGLHTISGRYAVGTFGRGRHAPWEIRLEVQPGKVTVWYDYRPVRVFEGEVQAPLSEYEGLPGDFGRLVEVGAQVGLRETDGSLMVFELEAGSQAGRLAYVEELDGDRDTFVYDPAGRLIRIENTNGDAFEIDYNAAGRIERVTDPVGRETAYTYDAAGEHLLEMAAPEGPTRFTYVTGQGPTREHALASIATARGMGLKFEYDDQGRLVRQTLDDGSEPTRWQYGPGGRVTMTDAVGNAIVTDMDHQSRLRQLVDGLGQVVRSDYHKSGLLSQATGPDGTRSHYAYDDHGRLTEWVNPLGLPSRLDYAEPSFDRPVRLENARGNTTRFAYDGGGRLLERQYPDGARVTYAYDARGHLSQRVDARGLETADAHDVKGLLTETLTAVGKRTEYRYEARRNLIEIIEPGRTTRFAYDAADRLTRVEYPGGRLLAFEYDAFGRRIRMTDQDGFTLQYAYDAAGRLERLSDGQGRLLVRYARDAAGRSVRKELGNGGYTTYAYDAAHQLTRLANYSPAGVLISHFDYAYGPNGYPVTMTTHAGVWHYGYDAAGQLTEITPPVGDTVYYSYDAAGNRYPMAKVGGSTYYASGLANPRDQFTTSYLEVFGDPLTMSYDAQGNLIEHKGAGGEARSYTYDELNRLTGVSAPQQAWSYEYDALGQRIANVSGGQRREFLMDPTGLGDVVAVYDQSGQLVRRYIHGLGLVCAIEPGGNTLWYQFDALGSTSELTDAAGNVLNQYAYWPFGESFSASETVENPFQYIGGLGVMREPHGLHYMRARYYDSTLGRFTQPDPIEQALGVSLYAYVENSPVAFVDLSGEDRSRGGMIEQAKVLQRKGRFELTQDYLRKEKERRARLTPRERMIEDRKRELRELHREIAVLDFTELVLIGVDKGAGYVPFYGNIYALQSAAVQAIRGEWQDALWRLPGAIPLLGYVTKGGKVVKVIGEVGKFAGDKKLDYAYAVSCDTWDYAIKPALGSDPPEAESHSQVVGSVDPNAIEGPAGYGPERWVKGALVLPYTIYFENVRTATAPAQVVVITNQLSDKLDWTTFELGTFGFGGMTFETHPGLSSFAALLPLSQTLGVDVQVRTELDPARGVATWRFESVDPATGVLPEDPFAGFLPPNVNRPEGEGYVSYYIRAKTGAVTGDRIDAQAEIVFDINAPLATDPIFHTVDRVLPASQVAPLPTAVPPTFRVTWSGQDNVGLAAYDVFVSRNGGPYERWLASTTATSALYTGEVGSQYAFYSVATDAVGHREAAPPAADAWTQVVAGVPWIIEIGMDPGEFLLTLGNLIEGQGYAVERSATLQAADWVVAREWVATAVTMPVALPLDPEWPQMFFRVRRAAP